MAKTQAAVLLEITETLPEFATDFLLSRAAEKSIGTRIGYARDFRHFLEWIILTHPYFCDKKVTEITTTDMGELRPIDIDRYLTEYASSHSKCATARAKVSISAFYKYLVFTLNVLDKNPCTGAAKVSVPKSDYVVYLSEEEQKRLLQTIQYGHGLTTGQLKYHDKLATRDLAMITLFLDTGLRISELAGLDIGDVNFDDCSLFVIRKRQRKSQVYFSDNAASYLKDYLLERKSFSPISCGAHDALFTSLKGERLTCRQIEKITDKYVQAALPERAGKISPHKLRSSFAMGFYSATKDILTLQEKLGHDSLNTTNIYAKAASSKSKELRNWTNLINKTL